MASSRHEILVREAYAALQPAGIVVSPGKIQKLARKYAASEDPAIPWLQFLHLALAGEPLDVAVKPGKVTGTNWRDINPTERKATNAVDKRGDRIGTARAIDPRFRAA